MDNSINAVDIIANAAKEKKALDIKILNVGSVSPITDSFVVCTGNSTTQVKAIADEIEEKMSEAGYEIHHREGYRTARWILLDFGNVIAHVFFNEDREFYNIEKLWSHVEETTV